MNGMHLLDATACSGIWEGLSYRHGCESDETRWAETSLVFSEVRNSGGCSNGAQHTGGSSVRGMDPGVWWAREDSVGVIFQFVGKGISHWRGRQIPFTLRGIVDQAPDCSANGPLKITLIKRHVGSFSNVVLYEGVSDRPKSTHTFASGQLA